MRDGLYDDESSTLLKNTKKLLETFKKGIWLSKSDFLTHIEKDIGCSTSMKKIYSDAYDDTVDEYFKYKRERKEKMYNSITKIIYIMIGVIIGCIIYTWLFSN